MKLKTLHNLLRILIVLLGTGIGIALAVAGLSIFRLAAPDREVSVSHVALIYIITSLLFSLLFFAFSDRLAKSLISIGHETYTRVEGMPLAQFFTAVSCMVIGLIIAALVAAPIHNMGNSVFTTVLSTIIMVTLGAFGYVIGYRRTDDCIGLIRTLSGFSSRTATRRKIRRASKKAQDSPEQPCLLDTSALIDGRILDLSRKGFLSSALVVPDFIIDELQHLADSADPIKHSHALRGMEVLSQMQECPQIRVRTIRYAGDPTVDVDVMLLRMSRDLHAPVITCDTALTKAGLVSDLTMLNLNELATLMRPHLANGDKIIIQIVKEGKERNQGVGYLEDGTMMVVEEGRQHVGEHVEAEVTSSLQTSAGRMVFAKIA